MDLSNKKQYIIFKLLDDVIDITFPVQITWDINEWEFYAKHALLKTYFEMYININI
jgi:hypothetical protein